jgi:hypothetical protein
MLPTICIIHTYTLIRCCAFAVNMRNKSVSLCDKSYKIAQNMPNFSEWLRFQLLKPMKTPEDDRLKDAIAYQKPQPMKNYLCRNCLLAGHWTADCPNLEEIS